MRTDYVKVYEKHVLKQYSYAAFKQTSEYKQIICTQLRGKI